MQTANSVSERRYRTAFFGTPEFALPSLTALLSHPRFSVQVVVTQPDRPAGRGNKLQASPIKTIAAKHGIPILQPERIKRDLPGFMNALSSYGPLDVGVVTAFGQILPAQVLEFPLHGCINVHGSLLPRWRGAAPMQRAIMAGDEESGVCLMKMDEGLDTGAVFISEALPLGESMTLGELHDQLALLGGKLLTSHLEAICEGSLPAVPQPDEGITYAHKITSEECKIDWNRGSRELDRLIRALNPVPGAFTTLGGKRLKVFRITPVSQSLSGLPGEVSRSDSTLLIKTGDGAAALLEVQFEGKKRMMMQEFLRGFTIPPGTRLGAS